MMEKSGNRKKHKEPLVGKHIWANLYGFKNRKKLYNKKFLVRIVRHAVSLAKSRLYSLRAWKFGGEKGGVSVIALVLESHIAIHTWPEYDFASVDVYTCGEHTDPEKAMKYIVDRLKPKKVVVGYASRRGSFLRTKVIRFKIE